MKFKQIMLIAVITMLLTSSIQTSGMVYFKQEETWRYIRYEGVLHMDITGEEIVRDYLEIFNATCLDKINSISISLYYSLEVNIRDVEDYEYIETTAVVDNVVVNPLCLQNSFLNNTKLKRSEVIRDRWDIPILLEVENGTLVLTPPVNIGEVIGISRFNYDVIHKTMINTNEAAYEYTYERIDVYYEPLTNIVVHYVKTTFKRTSKGIVTSYGYVTLNKELNAFNELNRSVYEVRINERGVNKSLTMIVIYLNPNDANTTIKPVVSRQDNNTFSIEFPVKTMCFIQMGVVTTDVIGTTELAYYTLPGGKAYYTPKPINCENIYVKFVEAQIIEIREEEAFPEKNIPPFQPRETWGDLLTAVLINSSIFIYIYLISKYIASRIINSQPVF